MAVKTFSIKALASDNTTRLGTNDTILKTANSMIASGKTPEEVDAWVGSQKGMSPPSASDVAANEELNKKALNKPKVFSISALKNKQVKTADEPSDVTGFIKDVVTHPLRNLEDVSGRKLMETGQAVGNFIKDKISGPPETWHDNTTGEELTPDEVAKRTTTTNKGQHFVSNATKFKTPTEDYQDAPDTSAKTFGDIFSQNPIDRVLDKSIVGNTATAIAHKGDFAAKKIAADRAKTTNEYVINHPEDFHPEQVKKSKESLAQYEAEHQGVIENTKAFWKELKKDPGKVGISLVDSAANDPELFWAPGGIAARILKEVNAGTEVGRAFAAADAAATGGATMAAITAAHESSHGTGELKPGEIGSATLMGASVSAILGAATHSRVGSEDLTPGVLSRLKERFKKQPGVDPAIAMKEALEAEQVKADAEAANPNPAKANTPDEVKTAESNIRRMVGVTDDAPLAERNAAVSKFMRNKQITPEQRARINAARAIVKAAKKEADAAAKLAADEAAKPQAGGEVPGAPDHPAEPLSVADKTELSALLAKPEGQRSFGDRVRLRQLQGGSVDPELVKKLGIGAGLATAGAVLFPNDPKKGAAAGLVLSLLGFAHGSKGELGAPHNLSQRGMIDLVGSLNKEDLTRIFKTHSEVLRDKLNNIFIDRAAGDKTLTHPATYSTRFNPVFANLAKEFGAKTVLDPFGGVGTIGKIKNEGFTGKIIANELEPEWAALHKSNGVDSSMIGDARKMESIPDGGVDMIITSPTYGNALASPRLKSKVHDLTYANSIGRELSSGNSGRMAWGDKYRQLHNEAYKEFYRVVKPGGIAVINMKDFINKGQKVPVTAFHIKAMEDAGFNLLRQEKIDTPGMIKGKINRPTVGYENILVFQKPTEIETIANNIKTKPPSKPEGADKYAKFTIRDVLYKKYEHEEQRIATAYNNVGKRIGSLSYSIGGDTAPAVGVSKTWRRQNVASALYKHANERGANLGSLEKEVGAGNNRTADGQAFREGLKRKGQLGKASPEQLARIAAVATLATLGYAIAPNEHKLAGTLFWGLAGLVIPGGGKTILHSMHQSGVVSASGSLTAMARKVLKHSEELRKTTNELLRSDSPDVLVKNAEELKLVERFKNGDESAFNKIYKDHLPAVTRFINKQYPNLAKAGTSAEDVASDTFIEAYKALKDFKGDSQLSSFLNTIAKRQAYNAVEKAGREKHGGLDEIIPLENTAGGGESKPAAISISAKPPGMGSEVINAADTGGASNKLTPEREYLAQEHLKLLQNFVDKLPPNTRKIFIASAVDGLTLPEIAAKYDLDYGTVNTRLVRATKTLNEQIKSRYNLEDGVKLPKNQRGSASPEDLLKLAAITGSAAAGYYMYSKSDSDETANPTGHAIMFGIGAALLVTRGREGVPRIATAAKMADSYVGLVGTRINNYAPEIWGRILKTVQSIPRTIRVHSKTVDPFLRALKQHTKATQRIVKEALLTGNKAVIDRVFKDINDPKLSIGWEAVKTVLDTIGNDLTSLGIIKRADIDYFPRYIKDLPGLLKAIGKTHKEYLDKVIDEANKKMQAQNHRNITATEASILINNYIRSNAYHGTQPGFAKTRSIREITPELEPFYADVGEALHSHIRETVTTLAEARFFGKDIKFNQKNGLNFTDTTKSVGEIVQRLKDEGKLDPQKIDEIGSMLKSLFIGGKQAPNELLQGFRDLTLVALLGNPAPGIKQIADIFLTMQTQGVFTTFGALVKTLTGTGKVSYKETGLLNHISEDYATTSKGQTAVKWALRTGLSQIDRLGKTVSINAAHMKLSRLAKSERGVKRIEAEYGKAFSAEEVKQLVTDLKSGKQSDIVDVVLFAEMSKTQVISKLDVPQIWLDHPNGRLFYTLKLYSLKAADLYRREAYNKIVKGNAIEKAKGFKNLATITFFMGLGGATSQQIIDWLFNQDTDPSKIDFMDNALRNVGAGKMIRDQFFGVSKEEAKARRDAGEPNVRAQKASPSMAMLRLMSPPTSWIENIWNDPTPSTVARYSPVAPWFKQQPKDEGRVPR